MDVYLLKLITLGMEQDKVNEELKDGLDGIFDADKEHRVLCQVQKDVDIASFGNVHQD